MRPDAVRSILTRNRSPDVPFDRSINPYRGCEHEYVYCFARPSNSYLNLSSGLDFETRIFHKDRAAELLAAELRKPRHKTATIALGVNTDVYQPAERDLQITRSVLQVLSDFNQPVAIITKSAGIPTGVLLAPVIPGLNFHEMKAILTASAKAGAAETTYMMLRLPFELK